MEKLKKFSVYVLLASGSSWGLLTPAVASAGFFSISSLLSSITPQASASSKPQNSQTLPLLSAATNIDPNPSVGGGDISVVDGSALVSQEGPSGTSADIEARPSSSAVSVYVVREGDNLSTIAQMYDVSVNTIKWANDLQSGVIKEGQELVILPVTGIYHTVKPGDTVASLAKKYSAQESEIREHNDLMGELAAGAKILIPNGTIASAPAPAKPSAARAPAAGASVSVSASSGSSNYIKPASGVITQGLHGNNGVDIGAPEGTNVVASAAGTVIVARTGWNGGYGNYVVIQHKQSQTLYAHLSQISVSSGASVAQGQKVGEVGHTGQVSGATGNHLHFEVRGAANPFSR